MSGIRIFSEILFFHTFFAKNLKSPTPIEAKTAVTVPKGFTEQYIFNRNKAQIYDDIDKAVMRLNEDPDKL